MSNWLRAAERKFKIVGVSGDEATAWCPHQKHRKPALNINIKLGVWYCQACGYKGSFKNSGSRPDIRLMQVVDSLKELREGPVGLHRQESILRAYDVPHSYWTDVRGFSDQTIKRFRLGYDFTRNLCTIPVWDHRGGYKGIITRRLDGGMPKYQNPKGMRTSQVLYGAWMAKGLRKIALVEGPLDAVSCWDARVPALAMFGSRFSAAHRKILLELGIKEVVCMTDNDEAGDHVIDEIHDMMRRDVRLSVMEYRPYWNAKDPGELTPQQRRKGYHSAVPWHQLDRSV